MLMSSYLGNSCDENHETLLLYRMQSQHLVSCLPAYPGMRCNGFKYGKS